MSNLPVGPTSPGAFEAPVPRPTTGIDAAAFETVGQTVRHAAGALEGLRDILERLESSIARAVDHRQTEEQFGHLFLRAQAFVDASIAAMLDASRRAKLILPKSAADAAQACGIPYHRMTTTDSGLRIEYFKDNLYSRVYSAPC